VTRALTARRLRGLYLSVVAVVLTCFMVRPAASGDAAWSIELHAKDYVIGPALARLKTRHHWVDRFDDGGNFEVAVAKAAVPIPSPQCRMDYLILKIPFYYPENPKQASIGERRSVYDALVALQDGGNGSSVSMRVEAPEDLARTNGRRTELTSCSLFVALPLSMQVAR
jgi:hypothetical protein